MYRLYVDEVGTDDVVSVEQDSERYLSLTGIAMTLDTARDVLSPSLERVKADIFQHDPDAPVILHRKKIVKKSGDFGVLRDSEKLSRFDEAILAMKRDTDFRVITALIDKKAMLRKETWTNKQPYHYLMEVLAEKYVQFLERVNDFGDIMPEGRKGGKDGRLQQAFVGVRANGTYFVSKERVQRRILSSQLKFRYKQDNIAGLQLADLIAHPSHMTIREKLGHPVQLGSYCRNIKDLLLGHKYDRSESGRIVGYGMKWLP